MGAYLNVKTNVRDLTDEAAATGYLDRGLELQNQAIALEADILARIERRLDAG